MNSLKNYIEKNCDKKILENFDTFFDINKILTKDKITLLNLAKLLLFLTSFSSKKEKHLSLLTSVDNNFQNEFILSFQFLSIKDKNIKINIPYNEKNVQVSEISFFLSGGDFLHKKIEILDDTIIKNSEMYNSILDKREKEMAELKQSQIDLEEFNNQKDSEIEELKRKFEELNSEINKKNEENIQLKNELNNIIEQKGKEIAILQKQLKDLTELKDQEINKLNNQINNNNENKSIMEQEFEQFKISLHNKNQELIEENNELKNQINDIPLLQQEIEKLKINLNNSEIEKQKLQNEILIHQEKVKHYENQNSEISEKINISEQKLNDEIFGYQEKIRNYENLNREMSEKIYVLEQKLNSDPYYAREIMSKTLYDFAFKMMSENN